MSTASTSVAGPTAHAQPSTRSSAGRLWVSYLARRFSATAAIIGLNVLITFAVVRLIPGDPARVVVGMNATPDQVEAVRRQLGLDRTWWSQLGAYIDNLLHLRFGSSFVNSQPVVEMIAQRLPVTAALAVTALVIVLVIGFTVGTAVGTLESAGRARWATNSFTAVTSLLGALPEYVVGSVLVLVFALTLRWFPVQGGTDPHSMVLPVLAIAIAPSAIMARLVRNETVSVLGQDYLTAARSKRLPRRIVFLRHLMPNVVTSTLTVSGILLVALLGGTVITENVFAISGLGTQVVQSVLSNDYPSMQGIVLVLGFIACIVNLLVDLALAAVDPRVLTGGAR